jgi:hypothetical protein
MFKYFSREHESILFFPAGTAKIMLNQDSMQKIASI